MLRVPKASQNMLFGIPIAAYLLFLLVPMVGLLYRALSSESLSTVIRSSILTDAIRVSLITSLLAVGVTILAGTPLAYFLARRSFPGKSIVDVLIDLHLVLPPVVAGLALLMAFGRKGILGGALDSVGISLPFTTAAVVMAQVFVGAPFYVRAAKAGFDSVDQTLENISLALGASQFRTFIKVTVPLAMPSLIAGTILSWARAMSEFGATLIFAGNFQGSTQTFSLAIVSSSEVDLAIALVLSGILLVLSFLFLLVIAKLSRKTGWTA